MEESFEDEDEDDILDHQQIDPASYDEDPSDENEEETVWLGGTNWSLTPKSFTHNRNGSQKSLTLV